jgi:pSer/pThr/pTyr-binding forkhead associated (FHA) protein
MVRMIFRHISGARATEVDVVQLGAHRELVLGRAASAAVRFDPRGDSAVGRHHARIAWSETDPGRFELVDLASRNGTYVNGARVDAPVALSSGDVVQLGRGGPQVEVLMEHTASVAASSSA